MSVARTHQANFKGFDTKPSARAKASHGWSEEIHLTYKALYIKYLFAVTISISLARENLWFSKIIENEFFKPTYLEKQYN